jgi:hypothetical protein
MHANTRLRRLGASLAGAALAVSLMAAPAAAFQRTAVMGSGTGSGFTTATVVELKGTATGNGPATQEFCDTVADLLDLGQQIVDSEPDAGVRHDVLVTMLEWSDRAGDAGCVFS